MIEMNREHERRWLVRDLTTLARLLPEEGDELEQGYLFNINGWKFRVRREKRRDEDTGQIIELPSKITLKGRKQGNTSPEYEQEIETAHAAELLELAPYKVHKTRYALLSGDVPWEVDVFHDANEGLVIAEAEGSREAVSRLTRPYWAAEEVTLDPRYNNENLAETPWSSWPENL